MTIFYPADLLGCTGGPSYESFNCPQVVSDWQDYMPISIILAPDDCKTWCVISGDRIVMQSTDIQEVADYMRDFMKAAREDVSV